MREWIMPCATWLLIIWVSFAGAELLPSAWWKVPSLITVAVFILVTGIYIDFRPHRKT